VNVLGLEEAITPIAQSLSSSKVGSVDL